MKVSIYEEPQKTEETMFLKLIEENNSVYVVTVDEQGNLTNAPYVVRFDRSTQAISSLNSSELVKSGWEVE